MDPALLRANFRPMVAALESALKLQDSKGNYTGTDCFKIMLFIRNEAAMAKLAALLNEVSIMDAADWRKLRSEEKRLRDRRDKEHQTIIDWIKSEDWA